MSSVRLKISLPKDERESLQAQFAKRDSDACSDNQPVTERLSFPPGFEFVRQPWEDIPTAVISTSETVTSGVYLLFTRAVPGLNGMTIQDVLQKLQEDGCLSFPYGGSIRDQFLPDSSPKDLDMETNCDANMVIDSCNNAWGASNCIT